MDRGRADLAADTPARDAETLEASPIVKAEGIGGLNIPNEIIRKLAQELMASRGKDAIAFADYKATIQESAGLWDDAQLWRKIEGTLLAMIAD